MERREGAGEKEGARERDDEGDDDDDRGEKERKVIPLELTPCSR